MSCSTRKPAILAFAVALWVVSAVGAQARGPAKFMIKFEPGTVNIIQNEDVILKAAMYAVEKGYTLQIEGFSCLADADSNDAPEFRLTLAGKRAEKVRGMIMKYGVPSDNAYSISYEKGQCVAVITVLK